MTVTRILLLLSLIGVITPAAAEQSDSFGDYTVHYNAFTTDILDPTIARTYGIVRSSNRALLNIAVLRKVLGTTGQPVKAKIKVTAVNLNQQVRELALRELSDAGATYYIAEIPVSNQETLTFTITVTPEGETQAHTTTYQQQFFTE
jgi:hypothetical protein